MRSFWSDPYLWIHVAGVAVVPAALWVCLLGLGTGDPALPGWLELTVLWILGIVPIAWMQWQKPFDIFSLLLVTLTSDVLTDDQRRLLTLFKTRRDPIWIGSGSVGLAVVLSWLYTIAPIAADFSPIPAHLRGVGFAVAAIAFLGANLFLQVPLSVLKVMLTSDAEFAATEPYPETQIQQDFTHIGLPVSKILPMIQE